MSIVAAVKVYDGIVLGADSATSIQTVVNGQINVVKTYNHAKKLFHIGKDLKIGVLTYGLGNIGLMSMESVVFEFNKVKAVEFNSSTAIDVVARSFMAFIKEKYDPAFESLPLDKKPGLGFYFGGYADDDILPQEWEFVFPNDTDIRRVRDQNNFGASWRGMPDPFVRLHKGFDNYLLNEMINTFNLDPVQVQGLQRKYESQVAYNGMPLQDAVDYVKFILLTTIGFYKFQVGVQVCSEPIDIIAITRNGYQEVKMKELK